MNYDFLKESLFCFDGFECAYLNESEVFFEAVSTPSLPKSFIVPFQINEESDIKTYLEKGIAVKEVSLDSTIFCVINVADFCVPDEWKTLVFYLDGLLVKSAESSTAIMNRMFKSLGMPYEYMRLLHQAATGETKHCVPYVLGSSGFLPIHGPCKKSVSWINLAHLNDYQKISGQRGYTRFNFLNRHSFDLPVRFQTFQKSVEGASLMYSFQYQVLLRINNRFEEEQLNKHYSQAYEGEFELENLFKMALVSTWKKYTNRSPCKAEPTFQKMNQYVLRRFSIKG
ncbi:competence protein ComK [Jeotgalibaca caeni]|uniref:competence protein ComK n=1 Tax=Jeotgalibaca caeni TaxID=3028623 RepID=UPI00237E00AF|nr:competence protein ComK [Jeotgalibaca caeni]MDE1548180.1 competence protein ComK [Jeotgalibaca caeni]